MTIVLWIAGVLISILILMRQQMLYRNQKLMQREYIAAFHSTCSNLMFERMLRTFAMDDLKGNIRAEMIERDGLLQAQLGLLNERFVTARAVHTSHLN